jgi:hypothetical protein
MALHLWAVQALRNPVMSALSAMIGVGSALYNEVIFFVQEGSFYGTHWLFSRLWRSRQRDVCGG